MITETEEVTVLDVPESDSEYPPEVVELWDREVEAMKLKLAIGELQPKTLREAAAERGIFYGV